MISYDLAKKLKDAGFPQPTKGEVSIGAELERLSAPLKISREQLLETAYAPTLSELIEACGEGEFQLLRRQKSNRWHAAIMKGLLPDLDWTNGPTPEEAVVNLLLILKPWEIRS